MYIHVIKQDYFYIFFLARIIFINLEMTSFVINYHIVEKGLGSSWTDLVKRQSRFKLVNEVNCM